MLGVTLEELARGLLGTRGVAGAVEQKSQYGGLSFELAAGMLSLELGEQTLGFAEAIASQCTIRVPEEAGLVSEP